MAKMNMNMTGRCDTVEQLPKKGRKQMEYRFRRAQNADVDQMMEIIRDRIKWMDKQGLHQWNKTDYMQQYPREYFLEGLKRVCFMLHWTSRTGGRADGAADRGPALGRG